MTSRTKKREMLKGASRTEGKGTWGKVHWVEPTIW